MIHLDRRNFSTNEQFFYHIYNTLGFTDLELAIANGDKWSKWIRYDWLMSQDKDKKLVTFDGNHYTVDEFMNLANNRTILDIEVVLDYDTPEQINNLNNIRKEISKIHKGWWNVYSTGGRGIHISLLVPELRIMSKRQQKEFKTSLISRLHGELIKSSPRVMIALEHSKHRKTGRPKTEI